MALSLNDCLHQARSIPSFSGTDDYSLSSYLRDMESIISMTDEAYHQFIKPILANKLRGKALKCVETLTNPTHNQIVEKLKEEFGIKTKFFDLRSQAMNVRAHNLDEMHKKLSDILYKMNSKFHLEGSTDLLYMPMHNEKMIFEAYINFMPCHIKTLLIQNGISKISDAYSYFIQNNLFNDVVLKNNNKHENKIYKAHWNDYQQSQHSNTKQEHNDNKLRNENASFNDRNIRQDNFHCTQRRYRPGNPFRNNQEHSGQFRRPENNYGTRQHQNNYRINSGNYRQNPQENQQQNIEPMDVDVIQTYENFRLSPSPPNYP